MPRPESADIERCRADQDGKQIENPVGMREERSCNCATRSEDRDAEAAFSEFKIQANTQKAECSAHHIHTTLRRYADESVIYGNHGRSNHRQKFACEEGAGDAPPAEERD